MAFRQMAQKAQSAPQPPLPPPPPTPLLHRPLSPGEGEEIPLGLQGLQQESSPPTPPSPPKSDKSAVTTSMSTLKRRLSADFGALHSTPRFTSNCKGQRSVLQLWEINDFLLKQILTMFAQGSLVSHGDVSDAEKKRNRKIAILCGSLVGTMVLLVLIVAVIYNSTCKSEIGDSMPPCNKVPCPL